MDQSPFEATPASRVRSPDGTAIAVFETADARATGRPPLVLVHGTTADHTTWRIVGPMLARSRRVLAMDRRGRGASGDAPDYAIEREFEDVAAVAEALGPVDVVGHSYGGRCALGASLRTGAIRRVVAYEGAPVPDDVSYADEPAVAAVAAAIGRGDLELALETFFRSVVGMTDEGIARYRADPVWPVRVAAAPTLLRELAAERDPAASLEALAAVRAPVLQVLGTLSPPTFRLGVEALAARLGDSRIVEIEGAAHAAHHTHPLAFVRAVEEFLDREGAGRDG
jgi:pimeloyl-ACP methyl ester carboxylesterase